MTFATDLEAASTALAQARRHTKPLPAELAAQMRERMPEKMAECERQVAEIAATIPALQAAYDALADRACFWCHGTGLYQCPTSHLTRGRPVCWKCGGSGEARRQRRSPSVISDAS
jgi:DnaJ-class molecular chaperone